MGGWRLKQGELVDYLFVWVLVVKGVCILQRVVVEEAEFRR